ncbi:MAG: hypothetical protein WBA71_05500 [Candidatus Humimicrobiia bacterium]
MDAGSALSGHYDTEYSKGEIMIKFMNLLGYDAISLGSMDFKYKMDEILDLNDKAEFPILSANLVSKQDKSLVFDAYTIIESSGRNIAIIGISPYPLEESSESDIIEKYETIDPIEAINKIIDDLRLKANIIIVLSSAGREIDEKIAKSIDAVDIIVAGSSNQITMEPVVIEREEKSDALIVESQVLGKKLGKLIVKFSSVGKIKEFEGELLKLDPEVEDDPEIAKILKEYLEQMKK